MTAHFSETESLFLESPTLFILCCLANPVLSLAVRDPTRSASSIQSKATTPSRFFKLNLPEPKVTSPRSTSVDSILHSSIFVCPEPTDFMRLACHCTESHFLPFTPQLK